MTKPPVLVLSLTVLLSVAMTCPAQEAGSIAEFPLAWPGKAKSSSHELTSNTSGKALWITGRKHDHLARVTLGQRKGTTETAEVTP